MDRMNKDKELIEEITNRLKAKEDFVYREGAWEKFKDSEKVVTPVYKHLGKYISAAAMLVVGLAFAYYILNSKVEVQENVVQKSNQKLVSESDVNIQKNDGVLELESDNVKLDVQKPTLNLLSSTNKAQLNQISALNGSTEDLSLGQFKYSLNELKPLSIDLENRRLSLGVTDEMTKAKSSENLMHHLILANATVAQNTFANTNLEKSLQPQSFRFGDHFDLGLYVSPYRTTDNLKVGAGFTFAYNITKKVSLRTGASFNNYEVGILKNPSDINSVEAVNMPAADERLNSYGFMATYDSKLMVPNINAVTGFVQSVEIPLEIKYNLNRSFYAVAGVSYSTILSQERNAQYVENANSKSFDSGFLTSVSVPAKEEKVVTKTVRSADNNVNTNGYNGFVNLSIGKKVDINRKFGVSVEPYFKIPVGEFRKSDMNYTNGGVRIMTNF